MDIPERTCGNFPDSLLQKRRNGDILFTQLKCDDRENSEFAHLRERRSPAESRLDVCRLVRPGAACESRTDAHRYRGTSVHGVSMQMRVVPRKVCLSSQSLGMKGFLFSPEMPPLVQREVAAQKADGGIVTINI